MSPASSRGRPALRRTTDDRVVAGVCGGLGERLSVDAVAVRVAFVLGAMVWGASLVVYAVLWRRVPEIDSPTTNPVRPTRMPSASLAGGVVFLSAGGLLVLRMLGWLPPDVLVLPLSLALVGVTLLWAGQPLRPVPRRALGSGAMTSPVTDGETEARYGEPASRVDRRPSPPFGSALIGSTLIVACLGVLLDRSGLVAVQWRLVGAVVVVVLGMILIGGTTVARPPGVIGLGAVVAIAVLGATLFAVPLGSGVGARTLRPASLDGLDTHLAGGSLTVDISELDPDRLGPEPALEASVAIGTLRVVVPIGIDVDVTVRSGLGAVTLFDDAASGLSVERMFVSSRADDTATAIRVDAVVGIGRVIVEQGTARR